MSALCVVGIDPSLTGTGISWSTGQRLVKSKGLATATLEERRDRLSMLAGQIVGFIESADLVVIEAPAFSSRMGSAHDRSGLWWLVVERLFRSGLPVAEVAPSGRAKYATGKGNAGKDEVIAEVVRRFPMFRGSNNNEADAMVLCAMGYDHLGFPLVDMPAKHREALVSVHWPVVPERQ